MAKKNISNYLAKFKFSKGNISKNLLYNVYVLYFFLFVSIVFLYGLVEVRDFNSVAIFILIGFVTTFFSKNMVVIMAVAIIFTALLKTTKNSLEGFSEGLDINVPTTSTPPSSSDSTTGSSTSTTATTERSSGQARIANPDLKIATTDDISTLIDTARENAENGDKKAKINQLMTDTKALKELEKHAIELLDVQQELIRGLEKMEPMLSKAESLSTKLESFGKH